MTLADLADPSTRPKKESSIEFNQKSAGAGEDNNRISNAPNKSQSSTSTGLLPPTETNPQPAPTERPSEMRKARELGELAGSFFKPSKPTTNPNANHAHGQPSHFQSKEALATHHNTSSTRRSIQQKNVRIQDTTEGVLVTTVEDTNMEDVPNPAPGGDKARALEETQLQVMQLQREIEEGKRENRKVLEDVYEHFGREKSSWEKKQKELQAKNESIASEFQNREHNFIEEIEYYKAEVNKQARKYKQQIDAMNSQLKEFEGWNSTLKTKNQGLEQEKASFAAQIEKMSQIVSQLNSKGLPLSPDDTYFTTQLASLVSDIRAWARGFNRGRPALTVDEMSAININLPDEIKGYLRDSFHNFHDLLESGSGGTKLRTRCIEAILLRSLLSTYLHERYIGMDEATYATIHNIRRSLHASDEEIRYWSALTSHLYTKTNPIHDQQDLEATQITQHLYKGISHFNDSPARTTKSTEASLKNIVLRVAKLGMEIAQLPFSVQPWKVPPGCKLRPERMDDIDSVDPDGDVDVDDEEKRTSIVLTPAWFKIVFDEEGAAMLGKEHRILLCKASVSCLN